MASCSTSRGTAEAASLPVGTAAVVTAAPDYVQCNSGLLPIIAPDMASADMLGRMVCPRQ